MIVVSFKSHRRDETCLKKFTNVLSYGKFIPNYFGWDIVKIGVIRVKVQFGEWISKNGLIKNFLYMRRVRKFVVGEMKPSIKQLYKKSSLFFFLL